MSLRRDAFIISCIGLVFIIISIVTIVQDLYVDLSKATFIHGRVSVADSRSIRKSRKRSQFAFLFMMQNSRQQFVIHRSYENYDDLEEDIRVGDTIKVYYRFSSESYNRNVYQVEKQGRILVSYSEYREKVSTRTVVLLFIGVIIMVWAIMSYRKINIFRILTRLVEGKPDKGKAQERDQ